MAHDKNEMDSYGLHRAAHKGSITEHQKDTIAEGSPDVLINGKPAWRAQIDVVTCKDHGPEIVATGSDCVLINWREAVREFDVALPAGAGAADPIVGECSNDVGIGQTGDSGGFGLDSADQQKAYCEELCQLCKDWPNLSRAERMARAEQLFHDAQRRAGVPETNCSWSEQLRDAKTHQLLFDANGKPLYADPSFDQHAWHLSLPGGVLDQDQLRPGDFGGNGYHESRHAEQSLYAMRYRATNEGLSWYNPADVERLHRETGVPRWQCWQALKQPPLDPKSREYQFGRLMDNLNNGDGKQHMSDAEGKAGNGNQTDYHRLANERDARLVGWGGNCDGCC